MATFDTSLAKRICRTALYLACLSAGSVAAAPVISQMSGTLNHKATVTITGSGFGTKGQADPVVWDDASGNNILNKWDGAWPSNSSNSDHNLKYRTPIRNIGLPHNNISRYIAGSHGDRSNALAGYNVIFFKNRTINSFPAYTYASWYQRSDDAWSFCDDNNYKAYAYSTGDGPYNMPNNWYIEYNVRPSSKTSSAAWHILDDSSLTLVDQLSWWWSSAVNPMSGQWTKVEVETKITNQRDGYIKLWENGVLKGNYNGPTDRYPGTSRTEGIGGYARCGDANNFRYFADAYLDYSRARVVLANNADLSKATIIETQIPSSWSNNTVSINANLGKFAANQTAFMFVIDPSGSRNAVGYPVKIGASTTGAPPPNPPTGIAVD